MTDTIPVETVIITKTKRNKRGHREERTYVSPGSRESKSYLVTIQLDDMRYTAESSGNFWDFNPTRLVVNDQIGVCIDKNKLVVKRPDGKNYKASIVRVVRTPLAERETSSSAVSSSRGWDRYVERPRLGRPCYKGMVGDACSTPGPSVRVTFGKGRR